jgi:predicted MPP superfamily phosphohydrolase
MLKIFFFKGPEILIFFSEKFASKNKINLFFVLNLFYAFLGLILKKSILNNRFDQRKHENMTLKVEF